MITEASDADFTALMEQIGPRGLKLPDGPLEDSAGLTMLRDLAESIRPTFAPASRRRAVAGRWPWRWLRHLRATCHDRCGRKARRDGATSLGRHLRRTGRLGEGKPFAGRVRRVTRNCRRLSGR